MKVKLSSVGNPDHGENPNRPKYGCRNQLVEVSSFKEASELCRKYIEDNDLGGGNWSGGAITENRKQIAHVSYNGRVWEGKNWSSTTKEIKF